MIERMICHLTGIQDQMVPIYAIAFVISHTGKKHAACLSLLDNVFNHIRTPVIIFPVIERISSDAHCISRAEDHTPMTGNTVLLTAPYLIILSIVVVHIKTHMIDTHLALDATLRVSFYYKFWW